MNKWEYQSEFLYANIENKWSKELLKVRWPSWKPKRYSPETMIPEWNQRGDAGWELIHMEPVIIGGNADVATPGGGGRSTYTNVYFCVSKRQKA